MDGESLYLLVWHDIPLDQPISFAQLFAVANLAVENGTRDYMKSLWWYPEPSNIWVCFLSIDAGQNRKDLRQWEKTLHMFSISHWLGPFSRDFR